MRWLDSRGVCRRDATLSPRSLVSFVVVTFLISACSAPAASAPTVTVGTTALPASSPAPSATPAPSPTPLPPPTPTAFPAGLFVDPGQQVGAISPLVYGTNIGPWTAIPLDEQKAVDEAGLRFLRFPGGEWGDQHNIDAQQLDDFIATSRRLGAEPSVSVRLHGGSPEQAAALVRYANQEKGYNVKYWSIGNEPTLYGDYDIERINREWRAIAEAMKAADPSIELLGPEVHQFDPQGSARDTKSRYTIAEFLRAFLKANGDLVDIVSIHRYPFPRQPTDGDPSIDDLRGNSREWDEIIPNLRALIHEELGRDLPVAVTEVNSNWTATFGGKATPDSHYGAIWWGDVLSRLIRQQVPIVSHFAIHGPQSQGWGLVHTYMVRPAYYVYRMFKMLGDQQVVSASDDPLVSVVAARRPDGKLTVMLTNLASHAIDKPLKIVGEPKVAEAWLFDAEHKANQVDVPADLAALQLPAESMTLLVFED